MREPGKRKDLFVNWALILLLLFDLIVSASVLESEKNSLKYGITYERSPLVLTQVEITNRQDLLEQYDLYGDEELYEICVTYDNPAVYNGIYRNNLDIRTVEEDYGVYEAYAKGGYGIAWQAEHNQVVPAGKSGCFSWFIAVPAGTESLKIEEQEEKLTGEGKCVTVKLPKQTLESVQVQG